MVQRGQLQADVLTIFVLCAAQGKGMAPQLAEVHLQRHALGEQIVVIAQGKQTVDAAHVIRQIGAMQLAGQIGLRA